MSEIWYVKRVRLVAGFEDGKGPLAREFKQPPEAGEGKEIDKPLEPPERNATLPMP